MSTVKNTYLLRSLNEPGSAMVLDNQHQPVKIRVPSFDPIIDNDSSTARIGEARQILSYLISHTEQARADMITDSSIQGLGCILRRIDNLIGVEFTPYSSESEEGDLSSSTS